MDSPVTTPTLTLFSTREIHIELSSKCTLKCPRCPRTELHPDNLNKEISLDDFVRSFTPTVLFDVDKIVFCGDVGDPIYAKDFLKIVQYIKNHSSTRISIVTNGSYKDATWWQELGLALGERDQITFSVDGWDQESNEKYRVNCNFDSIVAGARALRAVTKARMIWSMIYFSFNEHHVDKIEKLASDLGFDSIQYVRSSKFDGHYAVNGIDPLKPFAVASGSQYEKDQQPLNGSIQIEIQYTRDFHEWARCLNFKKELFINVEGLVFPCPWFNSGYQYNDFVQKHKDSINIKTRPLMDILTDSLWTEHLTRLEMMPLEVCKIKCRDCQ